MKNKNDMIESHEDFKIILDWLGMVICENIYSRCLKIKFIRNSDSPVRIRCGEYNKPLDIYRSTKLESFGSFVIPILQEKGYTTKTKVYDTCVPQQVEFTISW